MLAVVKSLHSTNYTHTYTYMQCILYIRVYDGNKTLGDSCQMAAIFHWSVTFEF